MNDRGDVVRREDVPAYGSVGPRDPHADPVTDPHLRPPPLTEQATQPVARRPATRGRTGRTVLSGLYVGLVFAALMLIFLLVFVLQNLQPVRIAFLGLSGELPLGVALLLSAVAGVLLVAIPGTGRILQLRRAARRDR